MMFEIALQIILVRVSNCMFNLQEGLSSIVWIADGHLLDYDLCYISRYFRIVVRQSDLVLLGYSNGILECCCWFLRSNNDVEFFGWYDNVLLIHCLFVARIPEWRYTAGRRRGGSLPASGGFRPRYIHCRGRVRTQTEISCQCEVKVISHTVVTTTTSYTYAQRSW